MWALFLAALMLLTVLGGLKNAPRRNALAILPALAFSLLYAYSTAREISSSFPWGLSMIFVVVVCGLAFFLLDRRAAEKDNIEPL